MTLVFWFLAALCCLSSSVRRETRHVSAYQKCDSGLVPLRTARVGRTCQLVIDLTCSNYISMLFNYRWLEVIDVRLSQFLFVLIFDQKSLIHLSAYSLSSIFTGRVAHSKKFRSTEAIFYAFIFYFLFATVSLNLNPFVK